MGTSVVSIVSNRRMSRAASIVIATLFILVSLLHPVLAQASTCPKGMSELDCAAINGPWPTWIPDSGDACESQSEETDTTSLGKNSSVYILGDSITVRAESAYMKAFSKKDIEVHINAAVGRSWKNPGSGKQTGAQAVEADQAEIEKADGIVIALGSNGGLESNPVDEVITAIRQKNPSAPIWWVNVTGTNAWKGANLKSYMGTFNKALDVAAKRTVFKVIDWAGEVAPVSDPYSDPGTAGADPDGLLEDGLHPNKKGVSSLSSLVVDAVSGASIATETTMSNSSSCCEASSSSSQDGNTDYRGRQVLNDAQVAATQKNQATYEKAAQKVDIPWQMLAVIHLRESGGKRSNPANGQGIYQFYDKHGGPYPAGAVSDDEFLRQTTLAAQFIKEKAGSNYKGNQTLNASSGADTIKDTFFSYNGRASVYEAQANALGYKDNQGYEGSPYVMNVADAKRDPAKASPGTWGQIKTDGGSIEYPANSDYGAYVMYVALGGTGSCSTTVSEGGLTVEQAKKFMMRYGENVNGFSEKQMPLDMWNACNGGGSNCVTFSYFFNHTFTNLPARPDDGNGESIVGSLRAHGADGGTKPKVFSTFSWSGGTYGHTGIVLGIHGNQIIVGQASCSNPDRGKGDGTYGGGGSGFIMVGTLRDNAAFWGTKPSGFAYPKRVDTQAIQEFIENGYVK